jgi:uncharacterized protein (DUF1501 family)
MSRRSIVKKRYPSPDSQYNSTLVSLLSARILKKGKKRLADEIVLEAFDPAVAAEKNPNHMVTKVAGVDVVIPTNKKNTDKSEEDTITINQSDLTNTFSTSLKWEPIDTNAVPGTDSLTFKPVLSSNCNFVNCLLYVLPSTSEPEI